MDGGRGAQLRGRVIFAVRVGGYVCGGAGEYEPGGWDGKVEVGGWAEMLRMQRGFVRGGVVVGFSGRVVVRGGMWVEGADVGGREGEEGPGDKEPEPGFGCLGGHAGVGVGVCYRSVFC